MNMNAYIPFENMNMVKNCDINKMKTIPGIWIDGKTYWLNEDSERLLTEEKITINRKQRHIHSNVDLSDVYITNHANHLRQCKLLFAHHYEYATRDHFTFISPVDNVIFHLADHVIYLVNGHYYGKNFTQSTVQPYWKYQTDYIWSNREQGILRYQPMAKGTAVSLIGMEITLMPKETTVGTGWIVFGKSKEKLLKLNQVVAKSY